MMCTSHAERLFISIFNALTGGAGMGMLNGATRRLLKWDSRRPVLTQSG
jgi:hypothetical protein